MYWYKATSIWYEKKNPQKISNSRKLKWRVTTPTVSQQPNLLERHNPYYACVIYLYSTCTISLSLYIYVCKDEELSPKTLIQNFPTSQFTVLGQEYSRKDIVILFHRWNCLWAGLVWIGWMRSYGGLLRQTGTRWNENNIWVLPIFGIGHKVENPEMRLDRESSQLGGK